LLAPNQIYEQMYPTKNTPWYCNSTPHRLCYISFELLMAMKYEVEHLLVAKMRELS